MIGKSAQIWIVLAALVVLGAVIGGAGALGAAIVLALTYYAYCLARPDAGLAWAFLALPAQIPIFQVSRISIQPFELFVWPACLIALLSTLNRVGVADRSGRGGFGLTVGMCGYFMVTAVILWGDRTPLEVRMWGGSLLFALSCYLKAGSEEFQTNLWRAFTTSAVLLLGLALSQRLFGLPFFQGVEEPRDLFRLLLFGDASPIRLANLTFQHFNSAGAYLTLLISALYAGAITQRRPIQWIGVGAAMAALYLTYSRGAALSTIIAILTATALTRRNRRAVVALFTGTVVAIGLILGFALPAVLTSEYTGTLSLGVRALIWSAYLQAWLQSPLIGLGPGNGFAAARFLSPYGEEYGAHNNYLYIAADFGLLGLAVLAVGLGAVIVRTARMGPDARYSRPLAVGAAAAVAALLVHGFFDHTLTVFAYRVELLGITGAAWGWSASRTTPAST